MGHQSHPAGDSRSGVKFRHFIIFLTLKVSSRKTDLSPFLRAVSSSSALFGFPIKRKTLNPKGYTRIFFETCDKGCQRLIPKLRCSLEFSSSVKDLCLVIYFERCCSCITSLSPSRETCFLPGTELTHTNQSVCQDGSAGSSAPLWHMSNPLCVLIWRVWRVGTS